MYDFVMFTCIGYKLPTFWEWMSIGEDSVRPSGAGLRNVHFLIMTHFKLEVMILCQGVSKILTANRILAIIFPFYHLKEEIRSFPTMYNTWGGSWGQFGETNHFLPKSGLKTLFLAVMVPDHLTSEWAGNHNF